MSSDLCIGIVANSAGYEVVALEHGQETSVTRFPATMIGIEAIRGFLNSCGQRIRLAVAGAAAVSLALTLGDAPTCQTFIVSSGSSAANQASALAHYADRAL